MLRGLWEHERPLSPTMIRSAMTALGILLAALAAFNVLNGLGYLLTFRFGAAMTHFTGGLAIPLAVWIGVRLLADLVVLENQAYERLATMAEVLTAARDETDATGSDETPTAKPRRRSAPKSADDIDDSSVDDIV